MRHFQVIEIETGENARMCREGPELAEQDVAFEAHLCIRADVGVVAAARTGGRSRTRRLHPVRGWLSHLDGIRPGPPLLHLGERRVHNITGHTASDKHHATVGGVSDTLSPVRHGPDPQTHGLACCERRGGCSLRELTHLFGCRRRRVALVRVCAVGALVA